MPSQHHHRRIHHDSSTAKSNLLGSMTSHLKKAKLVSTHGAKSGPVEFTQRKDKAGLLVTEELDKAIERCKATVEAIAAECRRRNRRFRDIEFDLDNNQWFCLHGLINNSTDISPEDTRRVPQIFNDPQFYIDGASTGDIVQGSLGDCWFLSALAIVTTMEGLIEKICVARDEKVGVYGFIFYRDAGWQEVIIDDLLCLSVPQYEKLDGSAKNLYKQDKDVYNETARKGSKSLYFAKSGTENETWVPLLEKAYAKLHGDYAALHGGYTCEALEDLTGGVSSDIPVKDILDEDQFWNTELRRVNSDRLFGCSLSGGNYDVDGLVTSHEYSIIAAIECKGKRFLKIRNPWGRKEWTGRWSDGSKEWTPEWLQALPALGHSFGDDGAFLMEYKDFLSTWDTIARTVLFDSTWTMSSQWLNVTSRTFPCAWSFGDVSFTFSIPKASPTVIVLAKLNDRHFQDVTSCYHWFVDFRLFKKGEKEHIGTSAHGYYYRRSVNLEIDLDAGDYVVHVRLDRATRDNRPKTWPQEASTTWDVRKLSRKMTEMTTSATIAANFDPSNQADFLPLQSDPFTGQDISEIEAFATVATPAVSTEAGVAETKPKAKKTKSGKKAGKVKGGKDGETKPEVDDEGAAEGDEGGEDESKEDHDVEKGDEEEEDNNEDSDGEEESSESVAVHNGFYCDGCRMDPIKGPRFHCLDSACNDNFDLCEKCADENKHDADSKHEADHKMLRINAPDDEDKYGLKDKIEGNENKITLGLRVYTKRDSPATVKGQLRHGTLLRWTKKQKDEKVGDNAPVTVTE
ncbi:hypothetical protein JAAARDRAFT_38908 [Jaapia argillacea MUCL 33604]|uniref:Calpain catalytic domain-containing protein n=1 Tax=Jaapia argillacea MUCL 33604 TaxID=933084 RepID=A0A067PGC3_9AGAM|nr:hypothetical protein JAAARDRAFT_38908 [Jaapia argillacea MUCL 33604]